MPEFELHFEWEESPRSRAAEFAATWARLEMRAGGVTLTRVEARRNQSVRSGISIPLYPIAEWMVRELVAPLGRMVFRRSRRTPSAI
jgi:hypothetical protein